jgi:hypothetical protein
VSDVPRVKIEAGVYRIGEYVVFREDVPSIGEFDEDPRDVTWGVVDGSTYDARSGDVGLPDALADFTTLKAATAWIAKGAR